MKDVLDRFGITEFFAVVCPGAFLLLSYLVWAPEAWEKLAQADFDPKRFDSIPLALLVLLLAYAFGLVLGVFAVEGVRIRSYLLDYVAVQATGIRRALLKLITYLLWPVTKTPHDPLELQHVVETLVTLGGRLAELAGGEERLPQSPYELVIAYRSFVAGQVPDAERPLLQDVEQLSRKRLFAQGVALALVLLAVQSVCRIWIIPPEPSHLVVFPLIAAIALAVSFSLRYVAGRTWEQELLYTYRLHLVVTQGASN